MKRLLLSAIVLAASTVFAGDGWQSNYKAALEQAAKENKPVLLDFTGSTWCPPCKMMKKEIFSTSDFLDFAKQNLSLAEKYQIEGFPTAILLDPKGKELARNVGYLPGGPKAFIDWVQKSVK
jgi:thioredoxin-related protein